MSRQFPRSTFLTAGLAAVLVMAVLLLMVVAGKDGDGKDGSGDQSDEASQTQAAEPQKLPELSEGFTAIAGADLFKTIAEAQRQAGSWEVSSVARVAEGELPAALQQIELDGENPTFRMQMQAEGKAVEGLWAGGTFYIKGLNPKKSVPWYQMPDDDNTRGYLQTLLESTDASSLAQLGEPASYDVVGVEDVSELDDDVVRAVHYRVSIDPASMQGGEQPSSGAAPELTIDVWVDAQDRPVQVQSTMINEGKEYTSSLFFSDYGRDFKIKAPPADQVTTKAPPAMRG